MRYSKLFGKTIKDAPKDEVSKNAQLLTRAGFVYKEMAGVYAYLPLGFRVIEKIKNIVREEMDKIGGQELIMTSLQRRELWEKTDRWNDENVDVWFKSKLKNGTDVGFGWSHEEQITEMLKSYISSYRDLPTMVYQFQTKLRNEVRAKSGIMRCREFVMKDLYSYTRNQKEHEKIYDAITAAYTKIFDRVGLGDKTYFTFASGGAFTQFSHEFQTICDAGEDTIYLDRKRKIAINEEILTDDVMAQMGVTRGELEAVKTAEVGNIFSFGATKAEQLGLYFKDEDGADKPVILGSYGVGITRLMGVIVEVFHDNKGIVWPAAVAPFDAHLISINTLADDVYEKLQKAGIDTLFDDRDVSAGEKFADADLIGIPVRLVVSNKTGDKLEFKKRNEKDSELLSVDEVIKKIASSN